MSHDTFWIGDKFRMALKEDAYAKIWSMNLVSLGRQPQSQQDADNLNDSYRSLSDMLQDQIRIADGKQSKHSLKDGEMVSVG